MKAAQINKYSKDIRIDINEVPVPEAGENDVIIRIKAAAVNPLDMLILTGSIKLIRNYSMPLTLGNECAGIVESTGKNVLDFKPGDAVYTRTPVAKIGTFAEYAAVDQAAVAPMPKGYSFETAAAIPLTGLTAYQAITEELEAKAGDSLLITGGSGSFGEIAVPVAKAMGLNVTVSGNAKSEQHIRAIGAEQYIDYRKENYWDKLHDMDFVIDTLGGPEEFGHALKVLKKGGRLLSLRNIPNKEFAVRNHFPFIKRILFAAAGASNDRKARRQGKEYRFMFVRSDGSQLRKITETVERFHIVPRTDPHIFDLEHTEDAIKYMTKGHTEGKVIIRLQ